jgi:hypothetical protein
MVSRYNDLIILEKYFFLILQPIVIVMIKVIRNQYEDDFDDIVVFSLVTKEKQPLEKRKGNQHLTERYSMFSPLKFHKKEV